MLKILNYYKYVNPGVCPFNINCVWFSLLLRQLGPDVVHAAHYGIMCIKYVCICVHARVRACVCVYARVCARVCVFWINFT